MSGYSARPLPVKLGIKPDTSLLVVNSPVPYLELVGELPEGVIITDKANGSFPFIHLFVKEKSDLIHQFPTLKKHLAIQGMFWVSWPKGSAHSANVLDEQLVQTVGLSNGLVDVKVCAINDTWSGLKFVYRLRDRGELLSHGRA